MQYSQKRDSYRTCLCKSNPLNKWICRSKENVKVVYNVRFVKWRNSQIKKGKCALEKRWYLPYLPRNIVLGRKRKIQSLQLLGFPTLAIRLSISTKKAVRVGSFQKTAAHWKAREINIPKETCSHLGRVNHLFQRSMKH